MMTVKAPKMRFKIGQFLRCTKADNFCRKGELWCIILAYRLREKPNEWLYLLEVRRDLNNPETPLSQACYAQAGEPNPNRVIYEPLHSSLDLHGKHGALYNDYCFGDRASRTTKQLLNNFQLVSSGEIAPSSLTHSK